MTEKLFSKYKKIFMALGLILLVIIPVIFSLRENAGPLKIVFLDIGQGDSILIETPNRRLILVDGGPNDAVLSALSDVLSYWQRAFDLIILTNPDRDHMDGLIHVLDRYTVKKFLISGVWKKNAFTKELLQKIREKNIPLLLAKSDEDFWFDGVTLDILFPPKIFAGQEKEMSVNNGSIVFMLRYKEHRILFPGDAEKETEYWLVQNEKNLKADILKAGHHGSKTSSSSEFLKKVKPKITVISSGKENRYGHPHQEVLQRLGAIGSSIKRTDGEGTIIFQLE